MAAITAELVGKLRGRTSAGMMECKKALVETDGDLEAAVEILRKSGRAKADKKAGRIAAEGIITVLENAKRAVLLEVNCETDFVARDDSFQSFVKAIAETALDANETETVDALSALSIKGQSMTVEEARLNLVAKVGENIQLRRFVVTAPTTTGVGSYVHGNRIGVLVELDVDNKDLARDIAMHVAASKPLVVSPDMVPADLVAKEKEIFLAQAATSGKPQDIIEKMVVGRLKKYLDEVSLMGQPFVKDPDVTISALLNKHRAKVLAFHRYEVGEGIDKPVEDFKETVMSQVQGN